MKRLLKIEWTKIYYYRATKIFTLLYFLLLLVIGLIMAFYKPVVGGLKLDFAKLGTFNFPDIWKNIGYVVAIAKIFIGIIIISNITNEFSNSTLKQNLIDGLTKREFLLSKVLTGSIFAILSTLFVFGISLILGLSFSFTESSIWEGIEFVGAYFIKLSLFFSICMFLAILLRKSGFAFLGIIILWFGEKFFTLMEFLAKTISAGSADSVPKDTVFYTSYLPLSSGANLIEFPTIQIQGFIMGGSIFQFKAVDWTYFISSIGYILIFTFLSYYLLKKRDL